jgi:hypothetical protein
MDTKSSSDDKIKTKNDIDDLKHLAILVKEVIQSGTNNNLQSGHKKSPSPIIIYADNYIKSLKHSGCKPEIHYKLYNELYEKYRPKFLNSDSNPFWMNQESESIEIHVGKGTGFERLKIILKLSLAFNKAIKMRETIENAKYDNINDKEEAYNDYKYQYLDLLYYRLFKVISNSDPPKKDIKKINKLTDYFLMRTHLDGQEESSNEADFPLKNLIPGEAKSIPQKTILGAMEKINSDSNISKKINNIFSVAEKSKKDNKSDKDLMKEMVQQFLPLVEDINHAMTGEDNKDKSEEESENTTTTSEEK